ncbi:contractile tail sheath protein gp18 [Synechococcus phage S-PM2]|uniref:Contractile tail sheath protein gp18 n=1 Tax=Synechococcus phage S-PM2 TaxID=238854 RepID=Q94M17_BPSYP|nr:contractile tail sheath protein gp18 [Synechococcus phage S-PM2]
MVQIFIVTVATLSDGTIAITELKDWYLNTEIGSTGIKLGDIGPRPGTSQFATDNGITDDQVHFAVIDTTGELTGTANTIVERLTYLSKLSDARSEENANIYYKNVINEQSAYLYHGNDAAVQIAASGEAWGQSSDQVLADAGTAFSRTTGYWVNLAGGNDDFAYDAGEFGAAMDLFLDTEETEIDFVLMGGSMADEADTKSKATKVIAIAASRKDALAFVSPHKGNQIASTGNVALSSAQQKENTIAFFSDLTSTSYAVFDSGYKYVYDRFTDKYRYIPCNGDVAGLCVQTSNQLDDWYSPAGLNRGGILNAVKLAYNPNKADRDELYQNRINPVVSLRGQGITLFGDKTALAAPSAFDRINVRRLFLNLEKRARRLAEGVLFEQNDATTRAGFSSALNSYLSEVQARRGVTDYLVICDESNNTPDIIDRNEFVAEVYVKPTRSINFITITFTATKTGVTFSEVVGR